MSDQRLRDLERAWRATGAEDAKAAWYGERLRSGHLDADVARGLVYLGHRVLRDLVEGVDDVCTSESCGRKISEHPIPASELRGETLSCPGYPLRTRSWTKWWRGFMENVPGDLAWRAMLNVAMREAARHGNGRAVNTLEHCVTLIRNRSPWESLVLECVTPSHASWHVLPLQTVVAWVLMGQAEEGRGLVTDQHLIHTVVDDRFPCPQGFYYLASQERGLDRIRAELRSWVNRREW